MHTERASTVELQPICSERAPRRVDAGRHKEMPELTPA